MTELAELEQELIKTLQADEEVKVGKFTLKIEEDDEASNPLQDFDGEPTFVCFHGRYDLGTKGHPYRSDMFAGWDGLERAIRRDNKVWAIKPLYMLDHSGITIATTPFGCPWDSGQIGFVYYEGKQVEENWSWTRKSPKRVRQVEESLENSVKMYDQYLRGEVYAYTITDENDNVVDSCGGFYDEESAAYSCVHDTDVDLPVGEIRVA